MVKKNDIWSSKLSLHWNKCSVVVWSCSNE